MWLECGTCGGSTSFTSPTLSLVSSLSSTIELGTLPSMLAPNRLVRCAAWLGLSVEWLTPHLMGPFNPDPCPWHSPPNTHLLLPQVLTRAHLRRPGPEFIELPCRLPERYTSHKIPFLNISREITITSPS